MKKLFVMFGVLTLTLAIAAPSFAGDDVAGLRRQFEEQRELNKTQQQQLEQQAQTLELLSRRLDEMAAGKPDTVQVATADAAKPDSRKPEEEIQRDNVGDLNSAAVRAGDFPGSFKIPGGKNVSLAIGGFIKTVAISDSDAEAMGSDFTPAYLGTRRSETDGAFNIDSTLTKMFLDGRAPTKAGDVRGYIEWDLNNANDTNLSVRMRHAYGTWKTSHGTLLAGHTWSTMMDLKILPEGLTEPTVSGAIFMRQPQIRWSQPLSPTLTMHMAIEDPSSSDVFDQSGNPELSNTRLPDGILGLEYDNKTYGHLRLNGILRDINVALPGGGEDSGMGWGMALSGYINMLERDRWVFSGAYGDGLGRYLLGIQSTAGSVINPVANELDLRTNWGVLTAYQHHWTKSLRSSAMIGHAKTDSYDWQPGNTFESSTYGAVNLMWQILPYMTMGVEYGYGQRENKDGSDFDNHRIAVGVQFF